MKIKYFCLLLGAAITFLNCQKSTESAFFVTMEDLIPLYFSSNSFLASATKEVPALGRIPWTANALGRIYEGRLSMTFITYQDSIYRDQRERLDITSITPKPGLYIIGNDHKACFATYGRWVADGDVLGAQWNVDTNYENYVEITEFDTISRIAKGRFNVHFKMVVQGSFGFVHSERINFKNGNFTVKF